MTNRFFGTLVGSLLLLVGMVAGPLAANARAGERYAPLVGVDKVKNKALKQDDLACAENDAGALSQVLEQNGYPNANIRLFVTMGKKNHPLYPKTAAIRAQLKEVARNCKEGDTML